METVAQVSQAMQTVLTTLAEAADVELHYTKRPDIAKFTASTLVQTLAFGWLAHPDATVEQLAQMAATVGVEVSPQAIDQRFTFATAALLRTAAQSVPFGDGAPLGDVDEVDGQALRPAEHRLAQCYEVKTSD